jgi:hypothetical protein
VAGRGGGSRAFLSSIRQQKRVPPATAELKPPTAHRGDGGKKERDRVRRNLGDGKEESSEGVASESKEGGEREYEIGGNSHPFR